MAKIELKTITSRFPYYQEAVCYVEKEIQAGRLRPIKSSGLNGKRPALYKMYQTVTPKKDYTSFIQELQTVIMPPLGASYYLHHLSQYEKDRPYVLALNQWIMNHGIPDESQMVSINERSFEIFGQEKYLKQSQQAILKRLGLPEDFLHCYHTYEPLMNWFSINKRYGQNILIVENLDPFITIRLSLLEYSSYILGFQIDTVIYGAGKRILASFEDLIHYGQPYLKDPSNYFYYLGDLDYEGIGIYEDFKQRYQNQANIRLFYPGYFEMIAKSRTCKHQMPETSEGQKPRLLEQFWDELLSAGLNQKDAEYIKLLLAGKRYIPQEILNYQNIHENKYSENKKMRHKESVKIQL